jgi:hypothetical protein
MTFEICRAAVSLTDYIMCRVCDLRDDDRGVVRSLGGNDPVLVGNRRYRPYAREPSLSRELSTRGIIPFTCDNAYGCSPTEGSVFRDRFSPRGSHISCKVENIPANQNSKSR